MAVRALTIRGRRYKAAQVRQRGSTRKDSSTYASGMLPVLCGVQKRVWSDLGDCSVKLWAMYHYIYVFLWAMCKVWSYSLGALGMRNGNAMQLVHGAGRKFVLFGILFTIYCGLCAKCGPAHKELR